MYPSSFMISAYYDSSRNFFYPQEFPNERVGDVTQWKNGRMFAWYAQSLGWICSTIF